MAITAPSPQLTQRSATDLAAAIRNRQLTAREVVQAHVDRLHARQPRTNALACDRFADALTEADRADERIKSDPDPPPFLGVPCTIKESIGLAGMPNCAGLVALKDRRAEADATAVARLKQAGFIPLGVTNTSEMTMWIESVNRVYGRTRNAYDPHRTAGGSSGGEGAAVGSGGSPVGLGSDIGGSIRVPAFFNGVFGHKPSPGLVPNTGQFPSTEGEAAYMLTLGPLTRHAEDLMPVTRIIAGPDGIDEYCVPRELEGPRRHGLRDAARARRRRRLAHPRPQGAARRPRPGRRRAAAPGRPHREGLAQAAPPRARDLPRRARRRRLRLARRAARPTPAWSSRAPATGSTPPAAAATTRSPSSSPPRSSGSTATCRKPASARRSTPPARCARR